MRKVISRSVPTLLKSMWISQLLVYTRSGRSRDSATKTRIKTRTDCRLFCTLLNTLTLDFFIMKLNYNFHDGWLFHVFALTYFRNIAADTHLPAFLRIWIWRCLSRLIEYMMHISHGFSRKMMLLLMQRSPKYIRGSCTGAYNRCAGNMYDRYWERIHYNIKTGTGDTGRSVRIKMCF